MKTTTLCYSWQRPKAFYSDEVKDKQQEFLLRNFSKGLFAIVSNDTLLCCWEESMDDHLALGNACRGFGQGRRALGSSDIPLQKRINIWSGLLDEYFRRSIPVTLVDDQAFNPEALSELKGSPGRFVSAVAPEGQSIQGLVGQTPQSQPLPSHPEMLQYWLGPLIQSIDGATPALFGGGEGQDNTVGATQIRLNQALERIGPAWMTLNEMFATAVGQAAKCCAENGNSEITGSYEGVGDIVVKPENLKGNVITKAETTNAIPESGTQKEAKVMMILDMANSNQNVGQLIASPSNAREIVNALHIDDIITIDEAESEDKQLEEIEVLISSEPLINPEWEQLNQQLSELSAKHDQAKNLAIQATSGGKQLAPDIIQQGDAMESQVETLTNQLKDMPQYLSSIPVAKDDSEDHATEASTCFAWMQESVGRSLRAKSNGKEFGDLNWNKWNNVYLHWQAHKEMIKQIASENAEPQIPKLSLTGKMNPDSISQLLAAAGVKPSQNAPQQPPVAEVHKETISRTPFNETKVKTIRKI
jgi:hypothetical protein